MVDSTFPYVDVDRRGQSRKHINLKGLAVFWLMRRGHDLDQIVEEKRIINDDGEYSGQTDISLNTESQKIHIECETGRATVSRGARVACRRGDDVYMFTEDGVYDVKHSAVTLKGPSEDTDDIKRHCFNLDRISDLPAVDLSAF